MSGPLAALPVLESEALPVWGVGGLERRGWRDSWPQAGIVSAPERLRVARQERVAPCWAQRA